MMSRRSQHCAALESLVLCIWNKEVAGGELEESGCFLMLSMLTISSLVLQRTSSRQTMCLTCWRRMCGTQDMILWVGISFQQSASTAYFRRVRGYLQASLTSTAWLSMHLLALAGHRTAACLIHMQSHLQAGNTMCLKGSGDQNHRGSDLCAGGGRLETCKQAVINLSEDCLWNLLSSCSNVGEVS